MENISLIKLVLKEIYYMPVIVLLIVIHPLVIVFEILIALVKLWQHSKRNKSLRGQVAVITGSGGGLDRCLALELAKRGCHVAVVDVRQDLADEIVSHITKTYQIKAKSYKVDVADHQQVVKLNEEIGHDLGEASILINIAGILKSPLPLNPKTEVIEKMIDANFTAVRSAQEILLEKMKKWNRGHIVNIFSISDRFASPLFNIYTDIKPDARSIITALRANLMHEYKDITDTTVMPVFLHTIPRVKDVFNTRGISSLLPAVNGTFVAQTILKSILNNEPQIKGPSAFLYFYKLIDLLPVMNF